MKIAYINADPDVPVFGNRGCSVHVQEVLLAMLQRGDEVHLFTTRIGDEAPPNVTALQIHPLPKIPRGDAAARERAALANNDALREALAREADESAFNLIYERHSLWSCAGMDFAYEQSIPCVLEVNAPLLEEQVSSRTLINRAAAEDVAMRAFRAATVITAVSRQLAHVLEQHPSVRGKIHIVPNAVNAERFASASPSLPKNGAFVIGFVGTLKASQGLPKLIEAFALVAEQSSRAQLLIVGDGPEREPLDRQIAARELIQRVRFTGSVAPESLPGLLASMDVAVAPYPALAQFYCSPLKLYEYMAAGLPIVASRIGQIEELIEDGETGLLLPPGDVAELARTLCKLESDATTRSRLGATAQNAVQDHTWANLLEYTLSLALPQTTAQPMVTP
jgi:glycosyltransferase involved in cell wall biosynthesis